MLTPWEKSYDKSRQCIKKESYNYANKVHIVNAMVALVVKNLIANAGDMRHGFHPFVRKTPLEEGTGTHFSILAWKIPWTG